MLCWKCHSPSSSVQSIPNAVRAHGQSRPHNSPYSMWCRIRRSQPSRPVKRLNSTIAATSFRLRLHDFSINEVLYCQSATFDRHSVISRQSLSAYKPVRSHRHSNLPDISDARVRRHLAVRRNILSLSNTLCHHQRAMFVEFPNRHDAAELLC